MNEYELYHYGIIGQKWGVRRYQNEDGTLTEEGAARYANMQRKKDKLDSKVEKLEKRNAKYDYKQAKLDVKVKKDMYRHGKLTTYALGAYRK